MLRAQSRHSWLYLVRNTTNLLPTTQTHFSINHKINYVKQEEDDDDKLDTNFSYEKLDPPVAGGLGVVEASLRTYDDKIRYDNLTQDLWEEAEDVHPADAQLLRDIVQDELDAKDPDGGLKTSKQLLQDFLVSPKQENFSDTFLDTSKIDPRLLEVYNSESGAEELLQEEKLSITESALASTLFKLQEKNKVLGLFNKQKGTRVGDPESVQKDFAKIGNSITDQLSLAQKEVNEMRNSTNMHSSKYQSNLKDTLEWADVDSFYRRNEMIYDDLKKKESQNITKFLKEELDTHHLSEKERQMYLIEKHNLQEEFYRQMINDEKEGAPNPTSFILNKFDQQTVEPWDHSQVEQYKRRKELQRENESLKLATAHIIHEGVKQNPLAFLQFPKTKEQHPLYGDIQQKIAQFYSNEEMKTQLHGVAAENATLDSFPIDRVTLLKSLFGDMTVHLNPPKTKDPAVQMEKDLKKSLEDAVDKDITLTNNEALRQLWVQVLHLSMPNPNTSLDPQQRQQQLQQRIKAEDIKSKDDFFEKIKYILPREKISNDKALNEKYLREEIIQKRLKILFPSLEYNVLHTIFERILNIICNLNTPLQNQGKVDAASIVETPRNSPAYWAINQLTQVVLNQNEKKHSQQQSQSQEKSFFFKLTEMASQPRPILAAIQESFDKFGRGKVKEREFMAVIDRLKMKDPSTATQPYQALYEILTPIHKQREEEKSNAAQKKERAPKIINGYAIGTAKRKSCRAQAKITPGNGLFTINGKDYLSYLTNPLAKHQILNVLSLVNVTREFDIEVTVRGGGITGQTDAITLAITNAISNFIPEFAHFYAKYGYLTRDPRVVERKKPGKKKARRSFQWVKR